MSRTRIIELATGLMISQGATVEAARRKLLSFKAHRGVVCWRFGDSRNGCLRRLDGLPLEINGQRVKAEAETRDTHWHRLIGLDDVQVNDRRDVLLTPEGSKDALAALHFADVENRLSQIGIVAALGAGVKVLPEDIEKFGRRRVRIFGDADSAGQRVTSRVGEQLLSVAEEVQIFNLAELSRDDSLPVKDLFDLTRICYDDFENNRDLWSVTDLDDKGERVHILKKAPAFLLSSLPSPHVSRESLVSPGYPVSITEDLRKELVELARRNACCASNTARKRRWQLLRDLAAVEKRISRKLTHAERLEAFENWHHTSLPHLDPAKTRDDYLASFLSEFGKVRVPTGEGEALKSALARVSVLSLSELPEIPDVPESWRRIAALHRELARQSVDGTYFLGCRDTAKAHPVINKDSASKVNRALAELGVISIVRIGEARPQGNASEFSYRFPLQ